MSFGQWYGPVEQVIDVFLSERRDTSAARRFLEGAVRHGPAPAEVPTDEAGPYLGVLYGLVPTAAPVAFRPFSHSPTESALQPTFLMGSGRSGIHGDRQEIHDIGRQHGPRQLAVPGREEQQLPCVLAWSRLR